MRRFPDRQSDGLIQFGAVQIIVVEGLDVVGFRLGKRQLGVNDVKIGAGPGGVFLFGDVQVFFGFADRYLGGLQALFGSLMLR